MGPDGISLPIIKLFLHDLIWNSKPLESIILCWRGQGETCERLCKEKTVESTGEKFLQFEKKILFILLSTPYIFLNKINHILYVRALLRWLRHLPLGAYTKYSF